VLTSIDTLGTVEWAAVPAATLADGDYGDITVSGTGTVLTIDDNVITLAKMSGGTAGNLITYTTGGDPTTVSTGTSGQVLTSNGAGAEPTFQAVTDANAIHDNVAAEISAITEKTTIDAEDVFIIESSPGSAFTKARITHENIMKPRIWTIVGGATITLTDGGIVDQVCVTGLTADTTISAMGVAHEGFKRTFRIHDNGTARTVTLAGGTGGFRDVGVDTSAITTTANKLTYIGCIYNATDNLWDVVAFNQEA
jgi:hypothetical protein